MFIDARGDGTNRGQLGTFSDHELHIVTNNATRMVVSENGNVGIGVTDPQSQLEVNGQVQANGILFSDGSVQTTATLVGPRGPRGEDGEDGAQGPQDPQGPQGSPGVRTTTSAVCTDGTENGAAPACGFVCQINTLAQSSGFCT